MQLLFRDFSSGGVKRLVFRGQPPQLQQPVELLLLMLFPGRSPSSLLPGSPCPALLEDILHRPPPGRCSNVKIAKFLSQLDFPPFPVLVLNSQSLLQDNWTAQTCIPNNSCGLSLAFSWTPSFRGNPALEPNWVWTKTRNCCLTTTFNWYDVEMIRS